VLKILFFSLKLPVFSPFSSLYFFVTSASYFSLPCEGGDKPPLEWVWAFAGTGPVPVFTGTCFRGNDDKEKRGMTKRGGRGKLR